MENHSQVVSFIWSVADLIRDSFKRGKYADVILPLTVLRRLDCVLAPTKEEVLKANKKYGKELKDPYNILCKASGYAFYNTSRYDFETLLADPADVAKNLRHYINNFSPNMREVIEKFGFLVTLDRLEEHGLLYQVVDKFAQVDLHPDTVPNHVMGTIFEELIRKFNEALDENPGEHFTPRDVVRLMVSLMLQPDKEQLRQKGMIATVADPCCGTGGMLSIAKDAIVELNPSADVHLFGQEVNPETFAICKSDLFMKSPDGRDGRNIQYGSTLSNDQNAGERFNYQLANPPYGKDWKRDKDAVEAEAQRGEQGRFAAGTPRISDGQLLFLQHMLSRMAELANRGGRVAIIMNGSPLFTGDAGSGESEIRRWILENDWLEALIALPEQMFYNTGIATYVWVLSNRKPAARKGKVQLIDATSFWTPMRKALGDKRREIPDDKRGEIVALYSAFAPAEHVKIMETREFGYRKVTIERPLRLNFQASAERIARLDEETAFRNLAKSRKKDPKKKAAEEADGRKAQAAVKAMLETLSGTVYKNRDEFIKALKKAEKAAGLKLKAPIKKAILSALGERDETAEICRDKHGNPEPDTSLRDYENVLLDESVDDYFEREVKPYVPDAWVDEKTRDHKDGEVGKVGYEVNFNRYFYEYVPPRPLEEIEADIAAVERDIIDMLRTVVA